MEDFVATARGFADDIAGRIRGNVAGRIAGVIAGLIVGAIANYTFQPIIRHVSYFIFYNRNIKKLENENKKLGEKKAEAEQFMDDAHRKFKKPVPRVILWHDDAKTLNEDVSRFLKTITGGSKKRWQTPCSRYSLSRRAFEMTKDVTGKLGEAPAFGDLAYDVPLPNIGLAFNLEGVKDFDSRRSLKNKILNALRAEGSNMIGICGMAGMGKTTLAKEIVRIVEGEKLFDLIAITTVSREPDVNKIQSDIISCFGWKIENVCNTVERARKLHQKFMESDQSSLLIFDDVWREMDDEYFEKIGLPSPSVIKRCKIILTSRSEGVCKRMGSKENFKIGVLSKEEAWSFFEEVALEGNSIDNRDLHQTATQILGELGGSPIAIATVGKALKNKRKEIWDDALRQLQNPNPDGIEEMDRAVYSPIKLSYNLLRPKEAQSCFLLCCLFPEDFNVPIELLVWYGMGLRLFQNVDNLQQARNRVHLLIDKLRESFLLLDGDGSETVKMHDLVRDVALIIASTKEHAYLVRCEAEMRLLEANGYKDAKAISLLYEETEESPVQLGCLKLELLQCKAKSGDYQSLPNNFFEGMKKLKVLQLSLIQALPQSLKGLEKLRTLICDSFENIKILGDLGNMEILAIRSRRLQELSKEIGLLRNLRLLDLDGAHGLDYFPQGVLPKLSKLEELYVSHGFNRWECSVSDDDKRINASLGELEYLHIATLQICVPKPSFLPTQTTLASLKRFNIRIGNAVESYAHGKNKLYIEGNACDTEDGSWFSVLSRKTEDLTLKKVENFKNSRFPQLSEISIDECDDLEYLVDNKHISRSNVDIEPASFSNLRKIDIKWCRKLKYVFPMSMARGLRQLQSINIFFCPIMEGMFCGKEVDDEIEFPNLIRLELCGLPKLIGLWADIDNGGCGFLPNQFINDDDAANNPSSTCCKVVSESDSAKEASTSYIANQSSFNHVLFPSTWIRFSNLQKFELSKCYQLEVAFPPNVAEQMVKLKTLSVLFCRQMQYIIGDGRSHEEKYEKFVFPNLIGLHCEDLPELVAFCADSNHVFLDCHSLGRISISGCPKIKASMLFEVINEGPSTLNASQDHQILFRIVPDSMKLLNIRDLHIENCNNLIYLFSPHVAKLMVKLEQIYITACEKMEGIVAKEHEEVPESTLDRIAFPQLWKIRLSHLHGLRSFYGGIHAMDFPLLESIKFSRCNQMKTFSSGSSLNMPVLQEITIENTEISLMGDLNITVKKVMEETIRIYDMWDVVRIGHDQLPDGDSSKCLFLDIESCGKLLNAIPYNLMASFQNLKKLRVYHCYSLEEIFEFKEGSAVTFSHLEQIVLEGLQSLKHIFNYIPKDIGGFQKLRILKVINCALRNVFSVPVARGLLQLQELEFCWCGRLKEVVAKEDEEEEETSTHQIVFPQLRLLRNDGSWHLECFYDGIHALEFPLLETLILPESDRLKNFSNGLVSTPKLEKVTIRGGEYTGEYPVNGDLNATISGWFINMEKIRIHDMKHAVRIGDYLLPDRDLSKCLFLDIERCGKLLNAIPYNLIAKFQNLKELQVAGCHSLEEIFEYEGGSPVTFSHLEQIILGGLPSVKHILNNIPKEIAGFRKLKILKVSGCSALRNVFSVSVARGLLQLQELELWDCDRLKEVVAKEEGKEEEEETSTRQIVFPLLRLLQIEWSWSFECFYSGIHALEFPLLETLILPDSDRLKTFSNGLVSTPKLKKVEIRGGKYIERRGFNRLLGTPKLEKVTTCEGKYTVNGDLNATVNGWFIKKKRKSEEYEKTETKEDEEEETEEDGERDTEQIGTAT